MASHGLTRTSGSGSIGRAPSLSSRMKQSCRLREARLLRLVEIEVGKQAPERRSTGRAPAAARCLLNQPMNCVASRRGMRLVSRKLTSSCSSDAQRAAERTVMSAVNSARVHRRFDGVGHARHWRSMEWAAAALADLAGEAEDAARAVARRSTRRCAGHARIARRRGGAGAVLRIRRGAVLPLRRRARRHRGAPPRRASGGSSTLYQRRASPRRGG